MKSIFVTFSLLFSVSAMAVPPSKVNFKMIALDGIQVLDSQKQDTLQRKIKRVQRASAQLKKTLEAESFSKIVSPIYELNEESSFANIYIYIAKTDEGVFEFVQAFVNKSGSIFVVDMNIVDVNSKEMKLVHNETEKYTVVRDHGSLFPF